LQGDDTKQIVRLMMQARCLLRETLHFVLGDMFGLRCGLRDRLFTLMLMRVAQSGAKGLPMLARYQLQETLHVVPGDIAD